MQNYDRAIMDCNDILNLDPLNVEALNNRGVCHWKRDHVDQSIRDFNEALRIDPTFVGAIGNRATSWKTRRRLWQGPAGL